MADILQQSFRKTTTFTAILVTFLHVYLTSIHITYSLCKCSPNPPNEGLSPSPLKKIPTEEDFTPMLPFASPQCYATVNIKFMLGVPAPFPGLFKCQRLCEHTVLFTVLMATRLNQTPCYNYQSKSTVSHVIIRAERKMHELVQMSVNWSTRNPRCSVANLRWSTTTSQPIVPANTARSYISKELNLWTSTVLYLSPVRIVRKHIRID